MSNIIKINVPIWSGRKVGVDQTKIAGPKLQVEVLYKKANGERLYPNIFEMDSSRALTYPTQVRRGVTLRIIPLIDFDIIGEQKIEPVVELGPKQAKLF